MLNLSTRKCLILLFLLFLEFPAYSYEVFDRYIGTLSLNKRGLHQIAKLDFISFRDLDSNLKIMAVLSLYFGGFNSDEYVSYHFDDVEYNLINNSLVFSQSDQDLTLKTTIFDGSLMIADVRSSTGRNIGTISLRQESSVLYKGKNLVSTLTGAYKGECQGRSVYLNLQTYRSSSGIIKTGNPFGSYKIKGQFGANVKKLCRSSAPCVTNQIIDGSYNFFNGNLTLYGANKTEQCIINQDTSIQCGSCRYEKNPETILKSVWPKSEPFRKLISSDSRLAYLQEGEYHGYLFHEQRKAFQNMSLDIVGYQQDKSGNYLLSSVANLYFGDFSSNEMLSYRFEDQAVRLLNGSIVLQRSVDDLDAIIKITDIGKNSIRGIWYSILFGRVGTFYVSKDNLPETTDFSPVIGSLSSEFHSPEYILNLNIFPGHTAARTDDPFYPLQLSGYFSYQSGITSRIMITGGSYDFYTGKIGIELSGGTRVSTGSVSGPSNSMHLRWSSNGFATIMQNFDLRRFRRNHIW
ncbi:MAG: hypothetical protein H6618_07955 [Deltaproteobacteria bacterium]|nr:hypothetical protein [Deltaproteobacteria bacterium]